MVFVSNIKNIFFKIYKLLKGRNQINKQLSMLRAKEVKNFKNQ